MTEQTSKVQSNPRKVIVCFDGVRREMAIPFSICCGKEALRQIRDCLTATLEREGSPFYYGWVEVVERPEVGPHSTPPLSWIADGSYYNTPKHVTQRCEAVSGCIYYANHTGHCALSEPL